MVYVDVMLGYILNKIGSDEIFKYTDIINIPVEYLAGQNLDGKESEHTVPVDVYLVADESGLIINYDANFGQIIFNELRDKVNSNYNKILGDIQKDKTISIDESQPLLLEKLDKAINKDLIHYQDDLEINRRYLVAAVRDGIKGNVLEPTPDLIYSFEKKYKFDEHGTTQILKEDKVMLNIIHTIISKGEKVIKDRTVNESIADFEADKRAS